MRNDSARRRRRGAARAARGVRDDWLFSHGYGVKAQGMGGVGIALPQDALAAATNPAGMAWVGNRLDVGLNWFQPDRSAEITGSGAGANGTYDGNGTSELPDPGIRLQLRDQPEPDASASRSTATAA